jgi:hypothetical protein
MEAMNKAIDEVGRYRELEAKLMAQNPVQQAADESPKRPGENRAQYRARLKQARRERVTP